MSINYKALHDEARNKWRFHYQGRTAKVHPVERAHLAASTKWNNEQTLRLSETDILLEALHRKYQAEALAILEQQDLPHNAPKAPVDPWGAYYRVHTGYAPRKCPQPGSPKPPKNEWKKKYQAFQSAMDQVDAATLTRTDIQAEYDAAKEAETLHVAARNEMHKRVCVRDEIEFCVYKWRKKSVS